MWLSANLYLASDATFKYITNNKASQINLYNGGVTFHRAATGTAGATATIQESGRFDNSGNFLVGTTNPLPANSNVEGIALSSGSYGGRLEASRSGGAPVCFNRLEDGSILEIKSGGVTAGKISTFSGRMAIGTGNTGLFFDSIRQVLTPHTMTGNTFSTTIDLGRPIIPFKDLYLSNKVYAAYIGASSDTDTSINFDTANAIKMFTGGQEAARIDASQRLLVGISAAITSTTNTSDGVTFGKAFTWTHVSDAGGQYVQRQNNGNFSTFYQGTTNVGSISVTGSTTSYNTSSDQRLKENIADADDSGFKVDAIQVRQFDWKANGSHQDYGMVAQELVEVAPEAVSVPEDSEEMMGVDYSKLVPMLIKEIQSLRQRVASLEE
jgi:hypothetical protein